MSIEYYGAVSLVEPGTYYVLINLYSGGGGANVTVAYVDPPAGISDWTVLGTVLMDLSNPYSGDFSDLSSFDDLNYFSNWWYPGYIDRTDGGGGGRLEQGFSMPHFPRKKLLPSFAFKEKE